MKRFLLSLLAIGLLSQCTRETVPPTSGFGKAFTLSVNESKSLPLSSAESSEKPTDAVLIFKLNAIEDSRCPANVQCVWMGEAVTRFTLEFNGQTSPVVALKVAPTGKERTDSTSVTVGNRSFTVLLKSVQPYPGTTPSDKPNATFVVRKQ
ncbi:MAG: hypothetical protein LH606_08800 [Cytophagaceae bacterium]|nr:hypothetical protein [Cytophagaceae bacterium]